MSTTADIIPEGGHAEAAFQLKQAAAAKKCWGCGCLHSSLEAIEQSLPAGARPAELDAAIGEVREKVIPKKYDCLGCEVCFPPLAMNALEIDAEACPTDVVEARDGWPPLPGDYTTLRYHAPIAICTLTNAELHRALAVEAPPEVAIVGTLYTENLGIERLIKNVVANPNIRFLLVCGPDSRQAIGHLPGQSLLALTRSGLDDRSRIIGARGKRPILKNIDPAAVEHFRCTIEVIDLIDRHDVREIVNAVRIHAAKNPGPATTFSPSHGVAALQGYLPERMVSDPAGYFVIYPDRRRRVLLLEHYSNDGVLRHTIEGVSAAELYMPAIDRGLVSRLDHAAYLGRELARVERALKDGTDYVQDAAPERLPTSISPRGSHSSAADSGCGCGSSCDAGTAQQITYQHEAETP